MNNPVKLSEFSREISEVLLSGGEIKIQAMGGSMQPTIKEKDDVLTLVKVAEEIKKNDIVLFFRSNKKAVLHRVINVKADDVTVRGDNQWTTELIKKNDIVAILKKVERNGKEINLKKYNFYLPAVRWSRRIYNSVKLRLGEKK